VTVNTRSKKSSSSACKLPRRGEKGAKLYKFHHCEESRKKDVTKDQAEPVCSLSSEEGERGEDAARARCLAAAGSGGEGKERGGLQSGEERKGKAVDNFPGVSGACKG